MRISFLLLLLNALFFNIASAVTNEEQKLMGALLKAIEKNDTKTVRAIAEGGYESIDRDEVLQEKIFNYFAAEEERKRLAEEKAKADALAKEQAEEKAKADALAAKKKAKADALAKKKADEKAAAAALAAKKAAEEKKKREALAAKKAKEQKIAAEKKRQAAIEKKRKAAAERKRQQAAAAKKKAAAKQASKTTKPAQKSVAKKAAPKPAAPKVAAAAAPAAAVPKAEVAVAAAAAAAPVVAAAAPKAEETVVSVSNEKLIGTWKQVDSDKVITLFLGEDSRFNLEEAEGDGTLVISGTWKSDQNIFMLAIKKVQRNVHSRDTDIHRVYTVQTLSQDRFVLLDKRDRVAYDLQR